MTLGFAIALVLTGHVVADFYVQTNTVAKGKGESFRLLMLHGLLYALCMLLVCLFAFSPGRFLVAWAVLACSHGLIDWGKVALEKRRRSRFALFCIDQALHVLIVLIVSVWLAGPPPVFGTIAYVASVMGAESIAGTLAGVLSLLVVWRPAALFVQLLLEHVRVEPSSASVSGEEELRAGRWIGVLERTIISVLTLCGQFTAIAFVLTAKSIARFQKLNKRTFAECYLVGTLASAAAAIVATLVIGEVVAWA